MLDNQHLRKILKILLQFILRLKQYGRCYLFGSGVSRNTQQAVVWLKKAAAQNYGFAYYHLGECYAWGVGVTQNYTEALKWYKKCLDDGDDEYCEMGAQLIEGIQKKDGEAVYGVGSFWYYGNEVRDSDYVEISQESYDLLITIKSSLGGTKEKKVNNVWDKTKTFVKEKSEKASEKTKELINKVKK